MRTIWDKVKLAAQHKYTWWFFVVVGIFLRLRQYLVNRSFWIDEANLALNIVRRSFTQLTTPLDANQGAPIGFLFIEKLFVVILGNKDYVLRIFPLICGLIAVYLMYKIAREYSKTMGLFSLFMFSISPPLVHYSSELKQYETDVVVALLLIYIALRCINSPGDKNFITLAIIGVICMWLSHPSVFVLAGIGISLAYNVLRRQVDYSIAKLAGMGAIWMFNLLAIYTLSVQNLATNDYLHSFWADDFLPLPVWENLDWLGGAYINLLSAITGIYRPLPLYFTTLYTVTIVFGFLPFKDRIENKFTTTTTIGLISLTLIASALYLYPIKGRFLLFLAPFIFLLIGNGIQKIYNSIDSWNRDAAKFVCFVLIAGIAWQPALLAIKNAITPPLGEHIKPVLEYIQENQQPNDVIYVYYGGKAAFEYYDMFFKFTPANIVIGIESQNNPEKYKEEIDTLKGKDRVWFVFSHNCDKCVVHEQRYYIQYLNKIGKVMKKNQAPSVNMYLYDLNP